MECEFTEGGGVMVHDLLYWKRMETYARDKFKEPLNGWKYNTLWVDGVPAPVIASWMRPGHGLLNERR